MDLSVIIVNWNSVQFLRECLSSVESTTLGLRYEVVVIDSGSFDGSAELVRDEFPQVTFIQSAQNVGFPRANNIAYRASRGSVLLFLNPDTRVIGPALPTMYKWLKALPRAGAIGCKLVNSDMSLQTSCIQSFPTILNQLLDSEWLRARRPKSRLWGMAPLFATDDTPHTVEAIAGACLMMPREIFERVGQFSEDYFMYAEDIDLSYKVAQAGYKSYYVPDAIVVHHGGGSSQAAPSDFSVIMTRESIYRFMRKTQGALYAAMYRASMFVSSTVRLTLLAVLMMFRRECEYRSHLEGSIRKWKAVLRWSLHLHELTRHRRSHT